MLPFSTHRERLDFCIRIMLAYVLIMVLFTLNIVALPHPFSEFAQIPLFLISVYYWAIYRPTLLPGFVVFVAGLLLDIFGGGPLGVNALIFSFVYWIVTDQRGFLVGQSFMMIWFGFGLLNAAVILLKWFIFGLLQFQWTSFFENIPAAGLGFVAFPFITLFLHIGHRVLPPPQTPLMRHGQAD